MLSQPHGSQNFPFPECNSEEEMNKHQKSLPNFTSYCVALPPVATCTSLSHSRNSKYTSPPVSAPPPEKQASSLHYNPCSALSAAPSTLHKALPAPNSPEAVSPKASVLQEAGILSQRLSRPSSAENHISNSSTPRRKKRNH